VHEIAVVEDAVLDLGLARKVVHGLDAVIDLLQRKEGGKIGSVGGVDDQRAEPEERHDRPHARRLRRVLRAA